MAVDESRKDYSLAAVDNQAFFRIFFEQLLSKGEDTVVSYDKIDILMDCSLVVLCDEILDRLQEHALKTATEYKKVVGKERILAPSMNEIKQEHKVLYVYVLCSLCIMR